MITSIKKALNYMQRNGIKNTIYASAERLISDRAYEFCPISDAERERQRNRSFKTPILFSVIVPTYNSNEDFLRQAIESVINQTYGRFELIIADASDNDEVKRILKSYRDERIRYLRLKENGGISSNTNSAIVAAKGQYVGLLDHDDLLTQDCLFENALMLEKARKRGIEYAFIYSDEDKCDAATKKFFEPNIKKDFDPDLLMTNNYICHFLVIQTSLIKKLLLRKKYDGAQDHDLVLRAYGATNEKSFFHRIEYGHIPKVLYHWRCHRESTSQNPESKDYAYIAGKMAVQDYMKKCGYQGCVLETCHKGFFRIEYQDNYEYKPGKILDRKNIITGTKRGELAYNMFLNRYDIGALGGPVYNEKHVSGGIIDRDKTFTYWGLFEKFEGYMYRAALQQQAYALDIRNMVIGEALINTFVKWAKGQKYIHIFDREKIKQLDDLYFRDQLNLPFIEVRDYITSFEYDDYEYLSISLELGEQIRLEGYINYYDPKFLLEDNQIL